MDIIVNMFNFPKRFTAILCFLLLSFIGLPAQSVDFNNYTPLKCVGIPPDDFLAPSYEKYYSDVADIKKNSRVSKKDKKLQKELSFITNYKIDDILMSGKVLYGNKVCKLINDIANKLLVKEPVLKKKMRFYLLNVPYANALSTNNGIVFVTTGLIAQLENEAQLAFVLSHEISHFKLNHSFESFKKSKDIMISKKYDDMGTDEKVLKILKYSKTNEADADAEGLEMFAAAGYNENEAISMMDILLYSYLPFDDIAFSKTYFNDSFYKIPESYMPDTAKEISAKEDEDDAESSHPNIEYRKANLEKYINDNSKGTLYLFGKDNFNEIIKLCRYELGYLMVVNANYIKAFYHAYLLEQLYGEGTYTAELKAAAIYSINKHKLFNEFNDEDEDNNKINNDYEGQISLVYSLFSSMKSEEFNILAAKTIYTYSERFPSNYLNRLRSDVFVDLFYGHKYMSSSFNKEKEKLNTVTENEKDSTNSENTETKETNSKVKKIKKKRKAIEVTTGSKYYKDAFIVNFKSHHFNSFMDSIEIIVNDINKEEEAYGLSELRKYPDRRYRQNIQDEKKIQARNGKHLGVDSLLLIAPSFSSIYYSEKKDPRTNSLNDELKAINITGYIERNAYEQNLEIDMIDVNGRKSMNSEQFNKYAVLSNWLIEKYNHIDKNDLLFSQKYADDLMAQGSCRNVCFTGFTYAQTKHRVSLGGYVVSAIFWPTFPLVLGYGVSSDKVLDYYYLVYDLKTGEQKLMILNTVRRRPKSAVINLQVSYSIFQTKSKAR